MTDKELDNYMKTVNPNFNSHIEKGTIEMNNEYYNLLEEKMARLINKIQELREALEIKSYCKYANKCNEIYDCSREEYEDMANANMRLHVENQELKEKFKATNKGLQKAVLKRKKWKYRYQLARCKIKELERIIELCHLDAKETLATINYEQESQQKEFINYLQRGINHYTAYVEAMDSAGPSIYSNEYDNSKIKIAIYKGILQKYKEIVNGSEQN